MVRPQFALTFFGCFVSLIGTVSARADAWDRDAVYAARVAELKAAIDAKPNDAQPLVDLAGFYLKPLAPRDVEAADGQVRKVMVPLRNEVRGSIKDIIAVAWVFRGDPDLAMPLLKKALEINPKHAGAIRLMAIRFRMKSNLDAMKPYMEASLKHDPMDLDVCRLYLDHRTMLARVLNDQAVDLRTPRVYEEERADGRYRVTQQPSQADYDRANLLDKQAQQARRDAIQPLQYMMGQLKNDPELKTNAYKFSTWHLGSAIYRAWIGELEKSAGSAKLAIEADPTNLDALDYLIDLLRGTRTKEKLAVYKPILDRWGGADSTPVIAEVKPRGPKR